MGFFGESKPVEKKFIVNVIRTSCYSDLRRSFKTHKEALAVYTKAVSVWNSKKKILMIPSGSDEDKLEAAIKTENILSIHISKD